MPSRASKPGREDIAEIAFRVVAQATVQAEKSSPEDAPKPSRSEASAAAAALSRLGASKGGKARAASLSKARKRRFTRLTNAFSKKVLNHEAAVALYFMHYNFARVHQTLRVTPVMEAGVADHVWTLAEIVDLLG